jgi:hypothetical protein
MENYQSDVMEFLEAGLLELLDLVFLSTLKKTL